VIFQSKRLCMRLWQDEDLEACFAIYGDLDVMRYLGATPAPVQTLKDMQDLLTKRIEAQSTWKIGQGMWAVVRKEDDQLIGAVIFRDIPNSKEIEPTNEVEVGWHFAKAYWHHGYATEAARAALDYGFLHQEDLLQVVAICYDANEPSKRVMERLGMKPVGMTDRFYDIETCCYVISRARLLESSPVL
jgi:[ribosomal protein S5]-alanine N-acetyltransferase